MRMRLVSSDAGFLKTFWARESKASCRLISSITQKDEGAVLQGFPVIRTRKIRILLKFRRNHHLAKR